MGQFNASVDSRRLARIESLEKFGTIIQQLQIHSDAMLAAGATDCKEPLNPKLGHPDQIKNLSEQCAQFMKNLEVVNSEISSSNSKRTTLKNELGSLFYLIVEHLFNGTRRAQIAELDTEIAKLEQKVEDLKRKLGKGVAYHGLQIRNLVESGQIEFRGHTDTLHSFVRQQEQSACIGWADSERWSEWEPPEGVQLPLQLRIGDFCECVSTSVRNRLTAAGLNGKRLVSTFGELPSLTVPAFIPFIGSDACYVIQNDDTERDSAISLFSSLILRISTLLPNQSRFTLIDPSGHGSAFPLRRMLQDVRESEESVYAELRSVVSDIRRINEDVLGLVERFELLPETSRASEKFEFVFCANFPNGYDRRAIDELFNIAATGPRVGKFVFIDHNLSHPLPRDVSIQSLRNAFGFSSKTHPHTPVAFDFDSDVKPEDATVRDLLNKVDESAPPEHALVWEDVGSIPKSNWWSQNSEQIIQTPVGGSQGEMDVWFGVNEEGRPCAHGMLGAMTGSGKSNLYHVLILGLSVRYSPKELQLYLIDGKDGVEFQPYQALPHAEVVSLKSSPELSRSVLTELLQEKERRNALFSDENVRDFTSYRSKGNQLPRILLLVDEYQELFESDASGVASSSLLQLAQQGRSVGIHMLLGSQQFGAPGMLNQSAILGNVHLRMAMKMDYSKVQALAEFGPRGKSLIRSCDLPGKIVINDKTGEDSGNTYGKVALISTDEQNSLVAAIASHARDNEHRRSPIIFNGASQPEILSHPHIQNFTNSPTKSPVELESLARSPIADFGFGVHDWTRSERPLAAWVGQEFSVRGGSPVVIRASYSHNCAILGTNQACREGILTGMVCSCAAVSGPSSIKFRFYDRSLRDEMRSLTCEVLHRELLHHAGFDSQFFCEEDQAKEFVASLSDELEKRKAMSNEGRDQPSILAVINEPNRSKLLRRNSSRFAKETNELLETLLQLLADGPQCGIHLVVVAAGIKLMGHSFDERRDFEFFNHRFALQMSEDDSFAFVGNRRASQLQKDGPKPVSALYSNNETGLTVRFKPFEFDSETNSLAKIGQLLADRK